MGWDVPDELVTALPPATPSELGGLSGYMLSLAMMGDWIRKADLPISKHLQFPKDMLLLKAASC